MTTLTSRMPIGISSVSIYPVFHNKYLTPHFNGELPITSMSIKKNSFFFDELLYLSRNCKKCFALTNNLHFLTITFSEDR